jgi:outer membrane protein assembly factor BamB
MKTSDHGDLFQSQSNKVVRNTIAGIILLITCSSLRADWPMYRNDAARSGYTTQRLDAPLQEGWIYRAPHVPHSAWPRSDRQTFDRAIQPVISDGTVYFGDTVTGVINALDLKTGTLKWRFFTEGPVRFAPVVFVMQSAVRLHHLQFQGQQ